MVKKRKKMAGKRKKRKSSKGALIKGMSKKIPRELLYSPMFKDRLQELMRKSAGVYALYNKNRLYYVGLSINLWGRIMGHMDDKHKAKWDRFIVFRIKRVSYLKDIETLLQHVASPPGNRVKGSVPRDANINHVLREELRLHKKTFRALQKAIR